MAFRSAEAWLAERGIEPPEPDEDTPQRASAIDATLQDQVAEAVVYVRRATAATPMAESRVRTRLDGRGYHETVVELAIERARRERLVDDDALARALVDEGRRKGNAPARLRADLLRRGLPEELVSTILDEPTEVALDAAAFAVARQRATTLRGVETEVAYRRLVGYLGRKGYPEQLAHRAARTALFDDRDLERTAGR